MVRLGRPANDNHRQPSAQLRLLAVALATALLAYFLLSL